MTIKYVLDPAKVPCPSCLDVIVQTLEKYAQSSFEYKEKQIFVFKDEGSYSKLEQEIKEKRLSI